MENWSMVVVAVGREPALKGLEPAVGVDTKIEPDAWIHGAWQLGHPTSSCDLGIIPGRDWLAAVWRDPDGTLKCFGRVRHHREYLGIEDDKTFYVATSADERQLVAIFDRAAECLEEEWDVVAERTYDITGEMHIPWLASLPGVSVTARPPDPAGQA